MLVWVHCVLVFGFYPCVYSEITLIVPLLSLMSLCLNSNHRKFDYGLKSHRRLFCLTLRHWVSPRFALRSHGAEIPRAAGQGLLRWHRSAEGPTSTSAARHWCLVSEGLSCVTPGWISSGKQALRPDLNFQHLQGLYLDAANYLDFSVFWREGQKGGQKPSRYLKHLVSEGGQKEMGWVSLGRLG